MCGLQGLVWYNGAGFAQYVGCDVTQTSATSSFTGLGGLYTQPCRSACWTCADAPA